MNALQRYAVSAKSTIVALLLLVIPMSLLFASCAIIGGIFKAGMAIGVIVVLLVLALVIWLFRKMGGRS